MTSTRWVLLSLCLMLCCKLGSSETTSVQDAEPALTDDQGQRLFDAAAFDLTNKGAAVLSHQQTSEHLKTLKDYWASNEAEAPSRLVDLVARTIDICKPERSKCATVFGEIRQIWKLAKTRYNHNVGNYIKECVGRQERFCSNPELEELEEIKELQEMEELDRQMAKTGA